MRPADSNAQSARTESRVLAALTKAGYPCYVPFGVGKADLIIETGQGLKTVQCKTGNVVNDGAVLRFKSSTGNRAGKRIGYRGIIDFFAVAAPDLPGIYLVPVDMMGETEVYLRLKPPMNWQTRRINMAEEFLVPNSRLL